MAADAKHLPSAPVQNGTHHAASSKPIELSITLPSSPGTRLHIQLTILAATTILFLTSASIDAGASAAASMGSFVMGMPDVRFPFSPHPQTLSLGRRPKGPKINLD